MEAAAEFSQHHKWNDQHNPFLKHSKTRAQQHHDSNWQSSEYKTVCRISVECPIFSGNRAFHLQPFCDCIRDNVYHLILLNLSNPLGVSGWWIRQLELVLAQRNRTAQRAMDANFASQGTSFDWRRVMLFSSYKLIYWCNSIICNESGKFNAFCMKYTKSCVNGHILRKMRWS